MCAGNLIYIYLNMTGGKGLTTLLTIFFSVSVYPLLNIPTHYNGCHAIIHSICTSGLSKDLSSKPIIDGISDHFSILLIQFFYLKIRQYPQKYFFRNNGEEVLKN